MSTTYFSVCSYNDPVDQGSIDIPHWLSYPNAADLLGVRLRDIRSMVADSRLVSVRRGDNNAHAISSDQFVKKDGAFVPLPSLRGTLIMLSDAGYSSDEAFEWLGRENDELGSTPMSALRQGRASAVRRVVAGLAF